MLSNQRFEREFLRPRYWLLWIGLGIRYLLMLLPYPLIFRLGHGLGRIAMRLMKHRVKIARRSVELCFPAVPATEREAPLVKNFESLGMENMRLARQANEGALTSHKHSASGELH